MGKSSIEIFARIRPTERNANLHNIQLPEQIIDFHVPKSEHGGLINNTRENYEFKFREIFDQHVKQDEIFEKVARKVIDSGFEGYNGTIFAYGQTGSGKTFTITGGDERYNDRGIIPRSLSYIFKEISERSDYMYSVYISYLEIYGNKGYDLLRDEEAGKLEDLPRVTLQEAEDTFHTKGMSLHLANNEEEALNLLFLGDTNRRVAETPMNDVSSRSHCIFSIRIVAKQEGSDVTRTSKINLVDLAGSERVSKTGVTGKLFSEAVYINGSLSVLEHVISQLGEKKTRHHISYRNSFMTSVLKDSLGGNCKTTMIATLSVERSHILESISTCRFAQRVALVKSEVTVNEEVDPRVVISRLKKEIQGLKEEIALLTGEERGELTESEKERVVQLVNAYIDDPDKNVQLSLPDYERIRYGFWVFKNMVLKLRAVGGGGVGSGAMVVAGKADPATEEALKKMKMQLSQRDNEINILVSMLHKKKANLVEIGMQTGDDRVTRAMVASGSGGAGAGTGGVRNTGEGPYSAANFDRRVAIAAPLPSGPSGPSAGSPTGASQYQKRPASQGLPSSGSGSGATSPAGSLSARVANATNDDTATVLKSNPAVQKEQAILMDRTQSFEHFRKSYRKNQIIEENKMVLKDKYQVAKLLAEQVNTSKNKINSLKAYIEQLRVERAMQGLKTSEDGASENVDPEEEKTKAQIEKEKAVYKDAFTKLKSVRHEIEHLHRLLEQSRLRLQKDFEQWYSAMHPGAGPPPTGGAAAAGISPRTTKQAWGDAGNGGQTSTSSGRDSARSHGSRSSRRSGGGGPVSTGNKEADADIVAFYKMKEQLLKNNKA